MEVTYSAHRAGKGIVAQGQLERLFNSPFFEQLQVSRYVHVERAAVFAERHEELLTHAGLAPFLNDMFLVIFPEVAKGRQNGVGARLPETAQR